MQSEGLKLNQQITLIVFELMTVFFGLKAFRSRMKSIWTIQPLLSTLILWEALILQSATLLPSKISGSFVLRETSGFLPLISQGRIILRLKESPDKEWNCYGQTYFYRLH